MRHRSLVVTFTLLTLLYASSAAAQATRTWISGVGDDANPCSRTAPCKTFAGAISKTAAGGEIDTLDPGGFGAVTITKSLTLNGAGTLASILFSGTTGVVINAPGATVAIRNLSLNGGGTGVHGIRIIAAANVTIDSCDIFNYSGRGISDERTTGGSLTVLNTDIRHSTGGNSFGIVIQPAGGGATTNLVRLDRVRIFGQSHTALYVSNGSGATVTNSSFHSNYVGVIVQNTSAYAEATLDNVQIAMNSGDGVRVIGPVTVRLANTVISGNGTNGILFSGGAVESYGDNRIRGNGGNNGAGMISVPRQ